MSENLNNDKNDRDAIHAKGQIDDVHAYFNSVFLPIFEKLYNDPKTRLNAVRIANTFAILDETLARFERSVRDPTLSQEQKLEIKNKTLETVKIYIKMLELAEKNDQNSIDEYINLLNQRYKEKLEFSFSNNNFSVSLKKK
ncbi:MAG: hypothetical protein N3E37_00750 [Candidatus Micrarchaeota archaeon]|nr:hypothetical protein [Candidatus Micrarchaeota archaeon]